ncbi:MAG: hypothetical protein LKJ49_01565 [Olsenella sp.]|jgi:hypothetical protein|nr:hypothetical protein [Olsenella sp.]
MKRKNLRTSALLLGATSTLVLMAYVLLLDDEARSSLSKTVGSIKKAVMDVEDVFHDSEVIYAEEEVGRSNREETLRQWASLGF